MATVKWLCVAVLVLGAVPIGGAESPGVLLEKGIHQEEAVGDLDAAIRIYEQIIREEQTNRKYIAEAKYRLGVCYLKRKQSAQAIEQMQELLARYADQQEIAAKAGKVLAAAKSGMSGPEVAKVVEEAVQTISTCAETDPRVPKALATLDGLSDQAVAKELARRLASDKPTVRRAAIYVLWKGPLTSIAPAADDLGKLLTHAEDLTRGMAALTLGGRKVEAAFDPIAKMALTDSSGYARRCAAYALGLMGNEKARETLQQVLQKDKDAFVRNNAEAALTMLSRAASAPAGAEAVVRREINRALSDFPPKQDLSTPEGAWAAWQRANAAKDANAAVALSWIKLDPARLMRFWKSGDPNDMKTYLDAVRDSKLLVVLTYRGDLAGAVSVLPFPEGKGRYSYSLRYLGRIDGQWKNLGEDRCPSLEAAIAAFDRKKQAAYAEFEALKGTAPSGTDRRAAEELSVEGWKLWGQGKLVEAEASFRQAVEKDASNANAWNGLGWAQQNQGKPINAKQSFQKCLALEPKHPGALNGLGWVAKAEGKSQEAMEYWRKAVDALPTATAALGGLAGTCVELGRYPEAIRYYELWLKAEPDSQDAKAGLAKARQEAKKAADTKPPPR